MQNFYRNYSPFFYNNIYRKSFISKNYRPFSFFPNFSKNQNSNNFPKRPPNEKQNFITDSDKASNIFNQQNLPPNKDFVLDLFGLKLYFDDVLILSLIFFLYKEDVKDEGLFLSLVLLLIS